LKKLTSEIKNRLRLADGAGNLDLGFRVFILSESNYQSWNGIQNLNPEEYRSMMASHLDPLVKGWTKEGVVYEILIKEGLSLGSSITTLKQKTSNKIISVSDKETNRTLLICLDDKIQMDTIRRLEVATNDIFICRDIALSDTVAANLATRCRLKTI
jgi:adenine-specific DNA-methyltransferase